jgi:hypothetical protein
MKRSNNATSIAATIASNGTASSQAAPHRKNAAQRNRSDSPYQGRTAQKDNPTQLIIKQAVDFLIRQVEAGKSETLAAYLTAMAQFHNYSFGNIVAIARQRAVTYYFTSLESMNIGGGVSLETQDGRLVAVRTNLIGLVDRKQSTRD